MSSAPRLTPNDWTEAALEAMARTGTTGVNVEQLAKSLGTTKGSFYHHFNGMKDYLDQVARFYGADQVRKNLFTVNDADPRMRLRKLGAMAIKDRMVPLDAAMRDWAGSNRIAAASVRAADEHLMRFIAKAFLVITVASGIVREDAAEYLVDVDPGPVPKPD